MVSSASSRVRAGERALRERRPRHGPYGDRTNARRLPHPRLTIDVAEDIVEESEGALAAIARRGEGPEMGRRDADLSVHAHVGAAEDDANDEVCEVRGVTPSRTMVRSGKNVLPVTDSEGVAMDDDANVTQQEVFGKNKDGIDEMCVDTTPAQGLICPEVLATEEEPAGQRSARLESVAAQIDYLERQVRMHNSRRIALKRASDARIAWITYPRACDRKIRKRLINAQAIAAEKAESALLHNKNLLEAKNAEQKYLLHGIPPSAAMEELLASEDSKKLAMVIALVKLVLA